MMKLNSVLQNKFSILSLFTIVVLSGCGGDGSELLGTQPINTNYSVQNSLPNSNNTCTCSQKQAEDVTPQVKKKVARKVVTTANNLNAGSLVNTYGTLCTLQRFSH